MSINVSFHVHKGRFETRRVSAHLVICNGEDEITLYAHNDEAKAQLDRIHSAANEEPGK